MKRAFLLSTVCLLSACNAMWGENDSQEVTTPPEEIWIMDHRDASEVPPAIIEDAPMQNADNPQMDADTNLVPSGPASIEQTTLAQSGIKPNSMVVRETLLQGDAARLVALEQEVQSLSSEIGALRPAMQKMMAAEGRLKELSLDLKSITEKYNIDTGPEVMDPSAAENTPSPIVSPVPPSVAPAQNANSVSSSGKRQVTDVRFGKNGAATRVVLDLDSEITYTTDLDNAERLLIVEMPQTFWADASAGTGSGVVKGYSATTGADGTARMIIELNQPVMIQTAKALPPSGQYGNRVYFDLIPQ